MAKKHGMVNLVLILLWLYLTYKCNAADFTPPTVFAPEL